MLGESATLLFHAVGVRRAVNPCLAPFGEYVRRWAPQGSNVRSKQIIEPPLAPEGHYGWLWIFLMFYQPKLGPSARAVWGSTACGGRGRP